MMMMMMIMMDDDVVYDGIFFGTFVSFAVSLSTSNPTITSTDNNSFTGTIPSTLGTLIYLYEIWLHNNDLVGTVPVELYTMLPDVYSIRVDGNSIADCPTDVSFLTC
jgi:hypothetical protein